MRLETKTIHTLLSSWLITIGLIWLTACSTDTADITRQPVAIEAGDTCHVCGMAVFGFPGPKGEAYKDSSNSPLKFCSTRDMFAYLMQPEVKPRIQEAYVHDAGATSWDNPGDDAFIDARTAWYVINHPLQGAMGATFAPFRDKTDAIAFAEKYNARVISFDEITLEMISGLDNNSTTTHEHMHLQH